MISSCISNLVPCSSILFAHRFFIMPVANGEVAKIDNGDTGKEIALRDTEIC